MEEPAKPFKPWSAREVDGLMLGLAALNLLGALVLGQLHGQLALAGGVGSVALAVGAFGVMRARGTLASSLALASALVGLVALQIHLAGGALVQHFNVFVTLSLLLAYRDWRPIVAMASLFALHHLVFDRLLQAGYGTYCLAAPDPAQIALHMGFVLAQCAVLSGVAVVLQREARGARELEFLVNAMGRAGKIRLNLDVIRAETPIGQRLQHVQHRMAAAIRAVHEASQRVDAAAGRVAQGSHELMQRTEATATGLRDSSMCLEQISVIVQHSTEASTEAKRMSETAAGMADQGGRLVEDVVSTMEAIETSSKRITDIIAVIDGIAFQTNILALNAAVEAARAGEQGRGFAVVAGEVRSLAQRSAAAAKEIKSLIGTSASTIEAGTRQVAGAGETMNQLVGSVRRVGELFESVTADTTEHMQGLHTVSQSVAELGSMTQQNVTLAERAGSAAADLQEQAARLAEVLQSFNLGAGALRASAVGVPDAADAPAAAQPKPPAGHVGSARATAAVERLTHVLRPEPVPAAGGVDFF